MKTPITFFQGIVIAIALPIILLIAFVIYSRDNSFKLVERDYYQKEINYQSQIDRETRANQLLEKVNIVYDGNQILLKFPPILQPEDISGKIMLFRPSDSGLDFFIKINLNKDGLQSIRSAELKQGAWLVKVFWIYNDLEYYTEKRIFVKN